MLLAPLTLGVSLLGLAVGAGTMIVVIALVRHRAWFASAPPGRAWFASARPGRAGRSASHTRE